MQIYWVHMVNIFVWNHNRLNQVGDLIVQESLMDVSAAKFLHAFLMASSKLCSLECGLRILLLLRSSNVFSIDGVVFTFSGGPALYETVCLLSLSLEEQIQLNALTSWPHIFLILMIARMHGNISNKANSMKMMYLII